MWNDVIRETGGRVQCLQRGRLLRTMRSVENHGCKISHREGEFIDIEWREQATSLYKDLKYDA